MLAYYLGTHGNVPKSVQSMYQNVMCIPLGEIRTLVAELLSLFFWFNHISFVSAYF